MAGIRVKNALEAVLVFALANEALQLVLEDVPLVRIRDGRR